MREEDFQKSPKTIKLLTSNQTTVKKFQFLIHLSKNLVQDFAWNNDLITQFLEVLKNSTMKTKTSATTSATT